MKEETQGRRKRPFSEHVQGVPPSTSTSSTTTTMGYPTKKQRLLAASIENIVEEVVEEEKKDADNQPSNPETTAQENNDTKMISNSNFALDEPQSEDDLCFLSSHWDARIRRKAMRGLLAKRDALSLKVYPSICQLCTNTDEFVRLIALQILNVLAQLFSQHEVPSNCSSRGGVKLRLVDDSFSRICNALNDLQPNVRAEAVKLLGNFGDVSESFLQQTLDKRLMKQMRTTKTAVNSRFTSRTPTNYQHRNTRWGAPLSSSSTSEWSTGRKLGEDVPVERSDEDSASIIPTGACGAFVTALEDEFMAVRQAAVYSLGLLAANRPQFSATALDHLADMFNDEIEQVRLDAIRALTPLVVHNELREEQLETILNCLDDALPESRRALHSLLTGAHLADYKCLRVCVFALLGSLRRFPADRDSIFLCMSHLGRNHSGQVQSLFAELLNIHPIFDTPEPRLEDSFYMARLVLVLNAAAEHAPIQPMLPAFVVKHYRYLRSTNPHMITRIPAFDRESSMSISGLLTESKSTAFNTVSNVIGRVYEQIILANGNPKRTERVTFINLIANDLKAMCECCDEKVTGAMRFLHSLCRLLADLDNIEVNVMTSSDLNAVVEMIDETITLSRKMELQFSNVEPIGMRLISECLLRLCIYRAIVQFEIGAFSNALQDLFAALEQLQCRLIQLSLPASLSTERLVTTVGAICNPIVADETKKLINGHTLLLALQEHHLQLPEKFEQLNRIGEKTVQISEPRPDATEPIRFVAGLAVGLPFVALLHKFTEEDLSNFRIKIDYPSNETPSLFRPRPSHFVTLDENVVQLRSQVLLSASGAWSDSADVCLSAVLLAGDGRALPLAASAFTSMPASVPVRLFPMHRAC